MISKACDCTVRAFMAAMYKQDYSGLEGGGVVELNAIYTEYIDISGIGKTKGYELLKAIHNLQCRENIISGIIRIQRICFAAFGKPFPHALEDLIKYGHRVKFDTENTEMFLRELEIIEIKERTNVAELDRLNKEMDDFNKNGVKVDDNGRKDFIRKLNDLGRLRFQIDKDKTTMEELALMISDMSEIVQEEAIQKQKASIEI
jgi:hypothetical protein